MTATLRSTAWTAAGTIADVSDLVPLLRENAARGERDRQVPAENIEALADTGLFRLSMPRGRGGLEASVADQVEALAEVARGCPSTSWVATISLAVQWMTALFPDDAQDEVYSTSELRMAGVFAPSGEAVRQSRGGGIVLNGRWAWNTGCVGADWAGLGCLLRDEESLPAPHFVLVPYSDLTILDDWDPSGLAATGSHTVVADDVVVPEHRIVSFRALTDGEYPHSALARANPYFGLPAVPVFNAVSAGTPQGIARGAFDVTRDRLPGRAITYTDYASAVEAPITHQQVGLSRLHTVSLNAHVRCLTELVDRADRRLSMHDRVAVRAHLGHAAFLAREIVTTLFQASGASAVQRTVPIQRYLRDVEALAQHALIQPTTTVELLGRTELGLSPNTTYL